MVDVFAREPQNQAPSLQGAAYNTVRTDAALTDALAAYAPEHGAALVEGLDGLGQLAGSQQAREHGMLANAHPPVLRPVDRRGARIDEVEFHPSWHWLMATAAEHGLNAAPWTSTQPHPHLRRAAAFVAWTHVEPGHACPMTMTYAAVPALRANPILAKDWTSRLAHAGYDPQLAPAATKLSALAGMGMTEKQGGSDVRTNVTTAAEQADGSYLLRGHKWFTSAPMNDIFLVLAQAPGGLTCFVLPRVLPDGSRNALRIVRLKDKLGNRSNASSEIEVHDALAWRLGDEGTGVRTIIEMVSATRLDCVLGSAALQRRSVAESTWHAAHRSAFGRVLADQPAMTNVLADLALESEAATFLGLRLAAALESGDDPQERALRRVLAPAAKFWVCKRTPAHVGEALEVLGGNGYVEESGMPLLFRESPLNSIWEGSGNVNALDVLRALQRSPESVEAWRAEVDAAGDPRLELARDEVLKTVAGLNDPDAGAAIARRLASRMALIVQASLLLRFAPAAVSDAFVATRIEREPAGVFGDLPGGLDVRAVLHRATPHPG
ncbi:acyl-CoA dehydrogenase family protein [Dermacoccaceae bacterium W4C1]